MTDTEYTIRKCERGFLVNNNAYRTGLAGELWAFDTVEEAAKWLVEKWGNKIPHSKSAVYYGQSPASVGRYCATTEGKPHD